MVMANPIKAIDRVEREGIRGVEREKALLQNCTVRREGRTKKRTMGVRGEGGMTGKTGGGETMVSADKNGRGDFVTDTDPENGRFDRTVPKLGGVGEGRRDVEGNGSRVGWKAQKGDSEGGGEI